MLPAFWYDFFYEHNRLINYQQDVQTLENLLQEHHPKAKTILDIACATGKHAALLSQRYIVDGLDINPDFAAAAQRRNQTGVFIQGDMTSFKMDKRYDVVICLSSSIGYVEHYTNLVKALKNFYEHLAAGGLLIVEPWFTPEEVGTGGSLNLITAETGQYKFARMVNSQRSEYASILSFAYMMGTIEKVDTLQEEHRLGLFTVDEMKSAFIEGGLRVQYEPDGYKGRSLYLGWKE
jgi:trans-aconitate methyltransferase